MEKGEERNKSDGVLLRKYKLIGDRNVLFTEDYLVFRGLFSKIVAKRMYRLFLAGVMDEIDL